MRRLLLFLLAILPAGAHASGTTAFVGVDVIPMRAERVLRGQTVIVEGGTITEIGPAGAVKVPAGAAVIPGGGRYLIPGLTDAHVHLFSRPELALYLANGVTTVFNLNGRPAHLVWRDETRNGKTIGPAIYNAGPTFMSRHSPDEAVRLVDEHAAAGYDAVKIYNQVGREELGPLTVEAKKKNLLLVGHVAREPGFEATLRAGVSIAHAEELVYTFFNPKDDGEFASIVFDESRIPAAARLAAAAGVCVIPTISTFRDIVRQATDLEAYLRNPELAYLAPRLRAGLQPGVNRYHDRYSPEDLEQLRRALPFQRKLVKTLAAAGVPLLAGTDATSIGPVAGFSIHEELAELVASGLTPFQALATATINPARYLRRAKEHGTVEVGKRADLVLLSADPLADIRNTRKIAGVMRDGVWLDAAALRTMIEAVPAAYDRELETLVAELRSDPRAAERHLSASDPWGIFGAAAMARLASNESPAKLRDLLAKLGTLIPDGQIVSEEALNELGYALLADDKKEQAIEVFAINAEKHPESANAFDSFAEATFAKGDAAAAVELYGKALAIDPDYPNAAAAKKFIEEHK